MSDAGIEPGTSISLEKAQKNFKFHICRGIAGAHAASYLGVPAVGELVAHVEHEVPAGEGVPPAPPLLAVFGARRLEAVPPRLVNVLPPLHP